MPGAGPLLVGRRGDASGDLRVASVNRRFPLPLKLAALLLLLASLLAASRSMTGVSAEEGERPAPQPTPEQGEVTDIQVLPSEGKISPPGHAGLGSNLNHIVEQARADRLRRQADWERKVALGTGALLPGSDQRWDDASGRGATAGFTPTQDESVAVTLYITEGYADAIAGYLRAAGVSPRNVGVDYIEASIPVSLLAAASEQEGVESVRAIIAPHADQGELVSSGVAAHGAPAWHAAGYRGRGVKIGVIDVGYLGFAELMGSELPATVHARCHSGSNGVTSDLSDCTPTTIPVRSRKHGTAVVEALFDVAPEAEYYISDLGSPGDLSNTVNWMVSEGVDVINASVGWIFDGPGDGTSYYSNGVLRSVDAAVAGGIIWVNGAGNSAGDSWAGAFADSDSDGVHEFDSAGDECNGLTIRLRP